MIAKSSWAWQNQPISDSCRIGRDGAWVDRYCWCCIIWCACPHYTVSRVDDETILIKFILLPYSPTTTANSGGHGGNYDEHTVVLLLIGSLPRASLKVNKFRTIMGVFLIRSRVFWLYREAWDCLWVNDELSKGVFKLLSTSSREIWFGWQWRAGMHSGLR